MSSTRPPPASLPPPDSEPAPGPSLPGELAFWSDTDPQTDAASAFPATDVPEAGDRREPTIGHIGRYALKHLLGEGGIGTVYAAHDPLLSRLIAVKTLHLEIDESEREAFNALFLNEARAAAGLSHPHIVTVFDAGISDDRAYIAMELLKGRDLRQLRQEGWRATPAQAALIVRRVADALAYAHSKGVVHCDVKPANIFMIGRTQPKVLDFGIARIAHGHDRQSHGDDIAAGSPYYMAPEQVRQAPVDRRADVFSLGVVLYELLTDVKPFRGTTLPEITQAVLAHEPPLAHTLEPGVPEGLALIAAKALAKDPGERHRSARAFSRELRHWLTENTTGPGDSEVPAASTRRPRRLGWRWGMAAAALGGLVMGGLVWMGSGTRAGAPVAGEPAASSARSLATAASAPTAAPASARRDAGITPAPVVAAIEEAAASTAVAMLSSAAAAPVAAPQGSASGNAATPASVAPAPTPPVSARPSTVVPKESTRDRRAREAREREARAAAPAPAAPLPKGLVHIAISPWGEVEVDGKTAGTTPPLTELDLPEGRHQIVVRNTDLPPFSAVVTVTADQPVNLKHKF